MWISFDPLTTCYVSISIYKHFDELLCRTRKHKNRCRCPLLERHYGQHPFKCGFLGCSFLRHGFTTRFLRDSHVRHHDRPWKCDVPSCEYAEIGFLSRRMRDKHLDSYHQEAKSQSKLLPDNLDADEIQPLLFDLVGLDKVEAVKTILHHFNKLDYSVKNELRKLAASSGSAAMVQLLWTADEIRARSGTWPELEFLIESIRGINFETLRCFLSRMDTRMDTRIDNLVRADSRKWSNVLKALLESGSMEMFQEFEKYLLVEVSTIKPGENMIPTAARSPAVIRATAGCPDREKLLLSLWAGLEMRNATSKFNSKTDLGVALGHVAETTCSRVLAKTLLEYGAGIDSRRSELYLTPLHRAARQSSPQAAELMRFLLYQGANPELQAGRSKLKISEEKGAKEIAKWLEMSWDELIQKVKLDRERGICPPEYT
jgi:Ankyrin repeat